MDFPGPHEKGLVLQELKVEPANSSQATGEGCGRRYSKSPWGIQAFLNFHSFPPTLCALVVTKSKMFQVENFG